MPILYVVCWWWWQCTSSPQMQAEWKRKEWDLPTFLTSLTSQMQREWSLYTTDTRAFCSSQLCGYRDTQSQNELQLCLSRIRILFNSVVNPDSAFFPGYRFNPELFVSDPDKNTREKTKKQSKFHFFLALTEQKQKGMFI